MRLKSISIGNVKSFREPTVVALDEKLNILVGPNGGGKSNLLDTTTVVLRHFFLQGWYFDTQADALGTYRRILRSNLFENVKGFLPRFAGHNAPSTISVTFVIRNADRDQLTLLNTHAEALTKTLSDVYRNGQEHAKAALAPFNVELFNDGDTVTYNIVDGQLNEQGLPDAAKEYLRYLRHHDLHLLLAQDAGISIAAQYLYFSPFRGATGAGNLEANLSGTNPSESRRAYENATSRITTSLIELATLRLAAKRLKLEKAADKEGFQPHWDADPEVKAVTKYLARVGYGWTLRAVDPLKNIYQIVLSRDGHQFDITQASTGEQEIINYLFGLFAFGLQGGLLVVDEVELHLHPRWQALLLDLLSELAEVTHNQVLVSTHSPAFITPRSVRNVVRVYRDSTRTSRVRRLAGDEATMRDMLHVVNSHNNERMFFADRVVLVEGITDRLVFHALVSREVAETKGTQIVEVLEVYGKGNFERYWQFLESFGVSVRLIADRDYLLNIGKAEVGGYFETDWKAVDEHVLRSKKSNDRITLAQALEEALASGDLATLRKIWEYIKARMSKLKDGMTEAEKTAIFKFVETQRKKGVFILRHGDHGEIEDYLPHGNRDVDGVIELTAEPAFGKWLDQTKDSDTTKDIVAITQAVIAPGPIGG